MVFDPSIVKTDSSSSSFIFWPPENFTVQLDCYIYDRKKNKIQRVDSQGYGTASTSDWMGHFDKFGLAGQRAMQKALQDLFIKLDYDKIAKLYKLPQKSPQPPTTERKNSSSGTGFVITKNGYILTCSHVIKDAREIKIATKGNIYSAKLIRDDPYNDLALLKINGTFPAIAFSPKRSAKMGQNVFTIGYPNPGLQGINAKYTEGTINSLTGVQDDLRVYQVSVPVQPGNSGGALLDEKGNVIGMIMAKLDAKTAFNISGSLPQNVNYAVKSTYAQALLDTLPEISDKLLEPSKKVSDAVERAQKSTVMILSYK